MKKLIIYLFLAAMASFSFNQKSYANPENWLDVLNYFRGMAKLPEVKEDPNLSVYCQEAAEYLAKHPDIAMINGGSIRMSIAAGQVTEMDVFTACPFSSLITIIEGVSPEVLKNLLENAYSRINADGGIEGASGTGRFAQIAGFRVVYNSKRKPGDRIKEVRLINKKLIVSNYKVVENAPSVNVATINFLARGGDEWKFINRQRENVGVTNRQALSEFIQAPKSEGGLNGKITSAEYPVSGSQRILRINE